MSLRVGRRLLSRLAWCACVFAHPAASVAATDRAVLSSPDPRFVVSELLFADDFMQGVDRWHPELEKGGSITAKDGVLTVDVPGGCSLWLKAELAGPVLITFEATAVSRGGVNDRVSDLNCFWMATDTRAPADLVAVSRSGAFSDYDELRCYYVGLGGNSNTTTRFRRYIGKQGNRPLLPEHDLTDPDVLLRPNIPQRIALIAAGRHIAYYRDGKQLFTFEDPEPYTRGWFAFRTVTSHFEFRNFKVYRITGAQ